MFMCGRERKQPSGPGIRKVSPDVHRHQRRCLLRAARFSGLRPLLHSNLHTCLPFAQRPGQLLPGMRYLCVIKADMSSLQGSLTKKTSTDNSDYWQLTFQVVMTLNRTRLQAKLRWTETVCSVNSVEEWTVALIKPSGKTARRTGHNYTTIHISTIRCRR
jgi:hypothetical protein